MASASDILTAIDDAILALVSRRVSNYMVDGTSYTYADLDKLRKLRREYAHIVSAENRASGGRVRLIAIDGSGS